MAICARDLLAGTGMPLEMEKNLICICIEIPVLSYTVESCVDTYAGHAHVFTFQGGYMCVVLWWFL